MNHTNAIDARHGAPETPDLAELVPLSELARKWPGRPAGRPLHVSALYRWASEGRLRVARVPGSGLCSCWRWVREFIGAAEPAASPTQAPRRPAAATRARRKRTAHVLARHGLASQEPAQ